MKRGTARLWQSGLIGVVLFSLGSVAAQANPEIVVNGSAAIIAGPEDEKGNLRTRYRIRLTPDEFFLAGSAWLGNKPQLDRGFITGFRYRMMGEFGTDGADGFTFTIQNSSLAALGGFGIDLGYDGIPKSLAIEFDTWHNPEKGDPNDNHISVHTRGAAPNSVDESASLGIAADIADLNDGKEHHVIITHFRGRLTICLDDVTVLSIPNVDLSDILDEHGRAYIGFTGGTGGLKQIHDIYAWAFRSN
jgi:hypothetical protein